MHQKVTSLEKLPPAIIAGRHLLRVLGDGVIGHVIGAVHGHVAHRVVHHVHGVIIGVGVVIAIRVTLVALEKLSPSVIAGGHLLGSISDSVIGHFGRVRSHVAHRVVHHVHGVIIGVGVVIAIRVTLVGLEKLSPSVIAGRHLLRVLGDGVIGHVISAVHGHVAHRVVHHVHGVIIGVGVAH